MRSCFLERDCRRLEHRLRNLKTWRCRDFSAHSMYFCVFLRCGKRNFPASEATSLQGVALGEVLLWFISYIVINYIFCAPAVCFFQWYMFFVLKRDREMWCTYMSLRVILSSWPALDREVYSKYQLYFLNYTYSFVTPCYFFTLAQTTRIPNQLKLSRTNTSEHSTRLSVWAPKPAGLSRESTPILQSLTKLLTPPDFF